MGRSPSHHAIYRNAPGSPPGMCSHPLLRLALRCLPVEVHSMRHVFLISPWYTHARLLVCMIAHVRLCRMVLLQLGAIWLGTACVTISCIRAVLTFYSAGMATYTFMSQFKPFGDIPRNTYRSASRGGNPSSSVSHINTPPQSPPIGMGPNTPNALQQQINFLLQDSPPSFDTSSDAASTNTMDPPKPFPPRSLKPLPPPLLDIRTASSPTVGPEKSPSPTERRRGPKSPLRASMSASGRNTPVSLAVKVPSLHELEVTPPTANGSFRADSVRTSTSTARSDSEDGVSWDVCDSAPSTPLRDTFRPQLTTSLAKQLAQTGKGVLGVIHSEDKAHDQVSTSTTHLSMKNCPLSDYNILSIPTMLVVLDISGSQLEMLPFSLSSCTSLEELNISGNPFGRSELAAPLASLRSLEHLRVLLADDCELPSIPQELIVMSQLQILGVRRNRLTCLPSWLYVLEYLDCLLLEGNIYFKPAWKTILHPLLHMDQAESYSPPFVTSNPIMSASSPTVASPSETRKLSGLLSKFKHPNRSGSPLDRTSHRHYLRMNETQGGASNDKLSTPPSRIPSAVRSSSSSSSQSSLVVPQQTPTKMSIVPVPVTNQPRVNPPPDLKPIECFLPVYDKNSNPEDVLDWFARIGTCHVRNLRAYLRDMDELLPDRQRELATVAFSSTGSSGFGSPTMSFSAFSSTGASDSTPVGTPGDVSMRNGILDEAGEAVAAVAAPSNVQENAIKRYRVLREIVETERTYVAGLTELMEIYLKRARQPMDGVSDDRVLSVEKERLIFGHIEVIIQFHIGAFLPALEEKTRMLLVIPELEEERHALLSAKVAADVANVFSEYAAYFKMYMNYVNQYETALRVIAQWYEPISPRVRSAIKNSSSSLASFGQRFLNLDTALSPDDRASGDSSPMSYSEHKKMQQFLKRCRDDPRHSQINLEGYLLLPIQRIPRYRLLLEQLIKCTSHGVLPDTDQEALARALAHISLVASWVNEGKRQSEQGKRLLQWQTKLRGTFSAPLVQPHRRLICDGPLRLRRVSKRSIQASSGCIAGFDDEVLEQMTLDLPVTMLLCNDLAVVLSNLTSEEASPHSAKQHATATASSPSGLASSDFGMVDLLAVLRPQVHSFPPSMNKNVTIPPASIVGQLYLRIVDAKYIYYFVTPSYKEAFRWQSLINAQSF